MEGPMRSATYGPGRFVIRTKLGRFAAYGLLGWCAEVLFTGIHDFVRYRDKRLPSRTSVWMFPVYGLLAPMYEPLHDAVRDLPAPVRATAYALGLMATEYSSGVALRKLLGQAPWDYSYARRHINGLVRPDYLPLWAVFGLALEPVHDILTGRPPA
jgi:uncharacterized membrane protein